MIPDRFAFPRRRGPAAPVRALPAGAGRRAVLGALLLAPALSAWPRPSRAQAVSLSAADQASLQQIQAYLNALRTLKARFLQIAPNGRESAGTAWLERPGRMRFQYDPPSPFLLVAGHGLLVFHDSELQQTSNIPLSSTPLGILLADNVQLSGPVTVTDFNRRPGLVQVTVVRTASPAEGSLTLTFVDNPLTLRSWTVLDQQRRQTRVFLSNVELGGRFEDKLFEFIDPRFFQNNITGGGG